jgi:hypothetical protein
MKILLKLYPILLIIAALFSVSEAQTPKTYTADEISRAEKLFAEANDLQEQEKHSEALAKYKEALDIIPDSIGLLYNGGLAAFMSEDYEQALAMWKKVKLLDEEDWQVRAKLIQTYQNLGRISERDVERKELFELRRSGKIKELSDAEFYVREQSEIAGRRIMVFEHFELKGERALRYAFYILDQDGKPEFRISLGSYETTNRIWREMGKRKPDERLFHLDGYFNGGHATYGMFEKEPTYDETREMVRGILEKEKKPISSSTIVSRPAKDQEKQKPEQENDKPE